MTSLVAVTALRAVSVPFGGSPKDVYHMREAKCPLAGQRGKRRLCLGECGARQGLYSLV